ncbi:helix-turn-helix domain-containing protein [Streptomyces sp. NPDC058374]|uniref:helix-turn-helix domain-containing protein n=1 Tax=Streptomyces sp. NPDC058374 TaxID=3346466 RepID=UPI00364B85CC
MSELPHSPELPAGLLTDPAMIDACRRRDFGAVFRLVKARAGIYPSMIARRCDLTPSRVGEVIAGRRQLVHMDVVERIADGLRVPGHMLGLARRAWETPPCLDVPAQRSGAPGLSGEPVAAGLPGTDIDSVLALAADHRPGAATLEALHSSITDYWRRDDEHGGETLRPAVVGQLRYVLGLLREQSHVPLRDGLHGIAAELAMLATREAFAPAALGDRAATHRSLAEAHTSFGRIGTGDPDPAWVAYFDETKLAVDTGIAHGRLGDAELAEPLITDALRREQHSNHRGRAFHAFWLARTQLQRGKLDEACHTATEALTPAAATASRRVADHLREFYGELAPHRREPVVLGFEARLRETLPGGLSASPRP